jgi:hypothetical protein
MKLAEDVKRAVVFLGLVGRDRQFIPCGTACFVNFDGAQYLVTVRHVALKIGAGLFVMALNKSDGTGGHVLFDPQEPGADYRWFLPDDPTVDLAIVPINKDFGSAGFDRLMIPEDMLAWNSMGRLPCIGDVCHAVGLFSRFPGKTRVIPVVHTGNLASLADGERITVRDRTNPSPNAEIESEGYLVELANLPGLSGAPVFFRPTQELDLTPLSPSAEVKIAVASSEIFLLGIWTGSWEGFEVGTERTGTPDLRVPVGMGFVTPVSKLLDLLQSGPVVEEREAWKASLLAEAPTEEFPS